MAYESLRDDYEKLKAQLEREQSAARELKAQHEREQSAAREAVAEADAVNADWERAYEKLQAENSQLRAEKENARPRGPQPRRVVNKPPLPPLSPGCKR